MSNAAILQPQHLCESKSAPKYRKELNSLLKLSQPKTRADLIKRLDLIMGRSLSELAFLSGVDSPYNNRAGKGFAGQLTEIFLGADAGTLSEPDFTNLGIELKTLPVGFDLMPAQSTFLCMADLNPERFIPFEQSHLYHKLRHMLFVILLAPKGAKITERRILGYFFFKPDNQTLKLFEQDYNEFNELILNASAREIDGSAGNVIQMRPKAAASSEYIKVRDVSGNFTTTYPRAYYLRPWFTKKLMQDFMSMNKIDDLALSQLGKLKSAFGIDPSDLEAALAADDDPLELQDSQASKHTQASTIDTVSNHEIEDL